MMANVIGPTHTYSTIFKSMVNELFIARYYSNPENKK